MKLYALADLHISHKFNHEQIHLLEPRPDDSIILAGDVGEKCEHLHVVFSLTTHLFKQVFWVPGNHELYTLPPPDDLSHQAENIAGISTGDADSTLRGEMKYQECVRIANEYGVITPEDEYVTWDDGKGHRALICPIFTLYDYTFRPAHITSRSAALDWAMETGVRATDEALLHSDPHDSREAWCDHLIRKTEARLQAAVDKRPDLPLVIINHWPLREELINIPSVPRFSLWCGTKRTEDWHTKFNAKVVVTGHLHVRRTDWRDGVRFEEVSLGYPRQWEEARDVGRGINDMLREILPGPEEDEFTERTRYRKFGGL